MHALWAPVCPHPRPPPPTTTTSHDTTSTHTGYAPLTARLLQLAHKPGWGSANCADVLRQLPGPTLELTQHPAAPHSFLPFLHDLDRLLAPPTPATSTAAGANIGGASAAAAGSGGAAGAGGSGGSGSSGGIRTASPLPTGGLFSVGSSASSTASSLIGGMSSLGLSSAAAKAPAFSSSSSQQQPPPLLPPAVAGKTLPNGRKVMLVYFVGGVSFMEVAALRQLSRQPDFPYQVVVCTTKLVNGNTLVQSLQEDIRNGLLAAGAEAGPATAGASGGASYWTPR